MRLSSWAITVLVVGTLAALNSPPAAAATASTAVLRWTATGNDSILGTAKRYDIRRSTTPLTPANFALGDSLVAPTPASAGKPESLQIAIPSAGVTYYFAIRTADITGNWSPMSNVAAWTAPILGSRPEVSAQASLSSSWPNPAKEVTNWTLSMPRDGEVLAEIYGADGRRIKVLASGVNPAGSQTLKWDLHSSEGGGVAPGVYWLRVRMPEHVFVRQVVITH